MRKKITNKYLKKKKGNQTQKIGKEKRKPILHVQTEWWQLTKHSIFSSSSFFVLTNYYRSFIVYYAGLLM